MKVLSYYLLLDKIQLSLGLGGWLMMDVFGQNGSPADDPTSGSYCLSSRVAVVPLPVASAGE